MKKKSKLQRARELMVAAKKEQTTAAKEEIVRLLEDDYQDNGVGYTLLEMSGIVLKKKTVSHKEAMRVRSWIYQIKNERQENGELPIINRNARYYISDKKEDIDAYCLHNAENGLQKVKVSFKRLESNYNAIGCSESPKKLISTILKHNAPLSIEYESEQLSTNESKGGR